MAKYVYVFSNSDCINLSDNFFDLSPDVPYMITMKEPKKFSFFSYYDLLITTVNSDLLLLNEGITALILYMILWLSLDLKMIETFFYIKYKNDRYLN